MTFKRRAIDLEFRLGLGGTYGESGTNTVRISGLRVQAQIDKVVGPAMGTLSMRVYGMTPDQMNALSALNQGAETVKSNSVTVLAGNFGEVLATVFQGQISVGQQNLNGAPETSMLVTAFAGGLAALQPTPPASYPGSADASVMMQNIAQVAGWHFENYGVNVQFSTPYLIGSPLDQARTVAAAGRFNFTVDDGNQDKIQTLIIWPNNGARGGQIPLISKDTGMIGYPDYSTSLNGLTISTEFNPFIHVGGQVQIKSDLNVANGIFTTFEISHTLESEMPGGQWMTRFGASTQGVTP